MNLMYEKREIKEAYQVIGDLIRPKITWLGAFE